MQRPGLRAFGGQQTGIPPRCGSADELALPSRRRAPLFPPVPPAPEHQSDLSRTPALKSPVALVDGMIASGTAKAALSARRIFALALLSGAHISFGSCIALAVGGNCPELRERNPGLQQFVLGAVGLPLGVIMTVVTGAELFTGNTCFVTTALLARRVTWAQWSKSIAVSYAGNLAGSLLVGALFVGAGTLHDGVREMALDKVSLGWGEAFFRGLLANCLICIGVAMAGGCADFASKALAIWLPVSAFVATGLEHAVANMTIIPVGMMLGAPVSGSQFMFGNLVPVTLGNFVGGAIAVAGGYMLAFKQLT